MTYDIKYVTSNVALWNRGELGCSYVALFSQNTVTVTL